MFHVYCTSGFFPGVYKVDKNLVKAYVLGIHKDLYSLLYKSLVCIIYAKIISKTEQVSVHSSAVNGSE